MEVVADILIGILLAAAVGFGMIGLIGLMIFPDIRSRQYTAVRSSRISAGSVTGAVLIYGIYSCIVKGGEQYSLLIILTLILFGVVAAFTGYLAGTVLKKGS